MPLARPAAARQRPAAAGARRKPGAADARARGSRGCRPSRCAVRLAGVDWRTSVASISVADDSAVSSRRLGYVQRMLEPIVGEHAQHALEQRARHQPVGDAVARRLRRREVLGAERRRDRHRAAAPASANRPPRSCASCRRPSSSIAGEHARRARAQRRLQRRREALELRARQRPGSRRGSPSAGRSRSAPRSTTGTRAPPSGAAMKPSMLPLVVGAARLVERRRHDREAHLARHGDGRRRRRPSATA